jgi:hypothetical protein
MQRRFSPGGIRFAKHHQRSRCLWREEQLMLHLLQRAVSPNLPLEQMLQDWFRISCALRESPRRRLMQVETLVAKGLLLS